MTRPASRDDAVAALAAFLRTDRARILGHWRERIGRLPPGRSLADNGARLLDGIATSLEQRSADDAPSSVRIAESFSAPRAIAELALLAETVDQVFPRSGDDTRTALHAVIDRAIAGSIARDVDHDERVRKRLELAIEAALVGSWELEPTSGVVRTDPRARELFGVAEDHPATVEGLTSQVHADDRERVRDGILKTLGSGRAYLHECRTSSTPEGGVRWVAIAAEAHESGETKTSSVLGIVHDVTAAKRAEEDHARVVEELSRTVHISETLIGVLSHDLQAPLAAILEGARQLRAEVAGEESARLVTVVAGGGERMRRMIEQLVDFTRARLGEGVLLERASTDLGAVARLAIEQEKAVGPASPLRFTSHGDVIGTWDGVRLGHVLASVVGNAIQHGQVGGTIDVAIDGADPERVVLTVHNQGTIPLHLLPVIFDPFHGTRHNQGSSKGLGLGLYVARQIALAHGGDLRVECTEVGTRFVLALPRGTVRESPSRQEHVREEELAAFERMSAPASNSSVTAQLFGAAAFHDRAPLEHADIVDRYRTLLDTALHRKTYRGQGEGPADELRMLAERLGDLGAGPREVSDIHARALRHAVRGATAAKAQALLSEGRLLALELMGNLTSYYRRRSRGHVRVLVEAKV